MAYPQSMRVLVVDNYDSFVYNLVQYLGQLSVTATVWRNDDEHFGSTRTELEQALSPFDGVLLSPGPGAPDDAGVSLAVVQACARMEKPLLGVCLGHQSIAQSFGGTIVRAGELLHGKTSDVSHNGGGVLAGLPSPFTATRYHSLTVEPESFPAELEITGRTGSGIIMAMKHRELPIHGVQFHPESVMTQGGHQMLANWLETCGAQLDDDTVRQCAQQLERSRTEALAG